MGTAMPSEETDVSVSENEEQPEEEEEEEPEEEEEEEEEETDDSMVMTPPVAQDPRNETAAAGGNGTNPVEDASSGEPVWDRVDVDTFAQTMEDNPNAFLLDVRTEPESTWTPSPRRWRTTQTLYFLTCAQRPSRRGHLRPDDGGQPKRFTS